MLNMPVPVPGGGSDGRTRPGGSRGPVNVSEPVTDACRACLPTPDGLAMEHGPVIRCENPAGHTGRHSGHLNVTGCDSTWTWSDARDTWRPVGRDTDARPHQHHDRSR